jgi:8-oxo-dGTP diphosphatase
VIVKEVVTECNGLNMKDRNTNIVAAFLVLRRKDKVLLSLRKNTGYRDGFYSLVCGHVERGETFTQAIKREAKEEAGIILLDNDLRVGHVMQRKSDMDDSERVDVFFVADKWEGEIINQEPDKCGGLKWFSVNKLPDEIIPCIRKAILNINKGIFYSEDGW